MEFDLNSSLTVYKYIKNDIETSVDGFSEMITL